MYALTSNSSICSRDYKQPTCPVYIVTGAAGNIEGLSRTNHTEPYTAKLISDFGIGVLHVNGATELKWEFLQSSTGEVMDSFTLTKDHKKGEEAQKELSAVQE